MEGEGSRGGEGRGVRAVWGAGVGLRVSYGSRKLEARTSWETSSAPAPPKSQGFGDSSNSLLWSP